MFAGLAESLMAIFAGLILLGVALTLFCIYTIPWMWHLLKPLLHNWTG